MTVPTGSHRRVFALVAAAGSGTRLGFDQPKAFVPLEGRTLLERSLDSLAASDSVDHAIVIVMPDMLEETTAILSDPINRAQWGVMSTSIAFGRGERVDSVQAGLEKLAEMLNSSGNADAGEGEGAVPSTSAAAAEQVLVAVHDAARCLVPPAMIREVVRRAAQGVESGAWSGAIPVLPVVDTIKMVDVAASGPAEGELLVEHTPARSSLRAALTPQVFDFDALVRANEQYFATMEISSAHAVHLGGVNPLQQATDDSSLMEFAGERVLAVDGDPLAMKITTPQDFRMAELLLSGMFDRRER